MEEDKSNHKIPLFNGNNFSHWKYRVGVLLDEKDLKIYIDEPLDDILNRLPINRRNDAMKREKKCKSILVQTIHDDQLENIKDKPTAKGMFDTLEAMFERKSVSSQLLLRKQLLTMKYNDTEEMIKHFLKFDKKIRELKSTGTNLEELDIVVHLLITLPKSYDNLVTALETMDQKNLSVEFVKSRLLDEYNKRKGLGESTGSKSSNEGSTAMQARCSSVICYKCGKAGHIKAHCRAKKGKYGQPRTDAAKPVSQSSYLNNSNSNKSKEEHAAKFAGYESDDDDEQILCAFEDSDEEDADEQFVSTSESALLNANDYDCNALSSDEFSSEMEMVLDSGATKHMVNKKEYFEGLDDIDDINISVAKKNHKIVAKQQGDIIVKTFHNGDSKGKTLKNVLYVKDLKCNLLSIYGLTRNGYKILFDGDLAYVSKDGETTFVAEAKGNLYRVVFHVERSLFAGISSTDERNDVAQNLWHYRLGHLNANDLNKMVNQGFVDGMKAITVNKDQKLCEPCVKSKHARSPFPHKNNIRSTRVLELVHTDVSEVSEISYDGMKYFVTFIDDYSRASMVYCMRHKSDVLEKFKVYSAMAEAQHSCKILKICFKIARLKCDNGGEYISNEFREFCKIKGIQVEYTVSYNPEMNGIAERLNRTLKEKALAMLLASGVERKFWTEAVSTANYIRNRCPTSAYGNQFSTKTPAELWFGRKPNISNFRIFGAICYNHIPAEKRKKMEPKSSKCIMFGYASNNAYRLWDIEQRKLVIGRNVIFDEQSIFNRTKAENISLSDEDEGDSDAETCNDIRTEGVMDDRILRRSERNRKPPNRYGFDEAQIAFSAEEFVENDPISISDAKQRNDWPEWKAAIESEYASLINNGTWTLCDLPEGRKTISSKWVFKLKYKANGDVDKHKARLVARGFTQKLGFDYNETYSPVAKLTTLRILVSIGNHFGMHMEHMDVKNAFLNGQLNEEIYMQQPEGFVKGNKVCKLNKALYGLKQASRMWNIKFNNFMIRIGFKRSQYDQCLYMKDIGRGMCIILLFVDDLLIFCTLMDKIKTIKALLMKEFAMTDLGKANSFLGIHIERDECNGTVSLNQRHYLKKVLAKFEMENSKSIATPMESRLQLEKGAADVTSNQPYRELMGCLTYAAISTRPDLCISTNYFSRFQSCYNDNHYSHAKRILRYIRGTSDMKLVYKRQEDEEVLTGYVDSDWANDPNDRKSTSGYIFKVFGNAISWTSRKQSTVALSSTEAEYLALAEAICEEKWIRGMLKELGMESENPTTIYEDNQSCIAVAESSHENKRLKHVDVKFNFIRESILNREVQLKYIPTTDQTADIMTKGLDRILFEKHRANLNLV